MRLLLLTVFSFNPFFPTFEPPENIRWFSDVFKGIKMEHWEEKD